MTDEKNVYLIPGAESYNDFFCIPLSPESLIALKGPCLMVYVALCSYVDEDNYAEVSDKELIAITHFHKETIEKSINKLSELGKIGIIHRHKGVRIKPEVALRWKIFKRDNYKCVYCGQENGPFEIDHYLPIAKGGSNRESNLVTSCHDCNRAKGTMSGDEFKANLSEK